MTRKRKFASLTERLLECEAAFVEAATEKLLLLYLKHILLILFVLGLGMLLVYVRLAIFVMIPLVNEFIVPIVIGLDYTMIFFQAESVVLKIGWDIIAGALNGLTFGATNLPIFKGPFSFYPKGLLSPKKAKAAINTFATTCISYDSVDVIFAKMARTLIGPSLCPVLRYIYPVKPLFDAAMWVLGWASPDPTPLGYAGENNCKDSPNDFSWVCAAVGVGYVVLEVVFPLMLLFFALEVLTVPTVRLIVVLVEEVVYIVETVLHDAREIGEGISKIEENLVKKEEQRSQKRFISL